jgi:predicted nucleic acid-binding protein
MATLDTNVIIRYLTQDDPDQAQRALGLLEQIESRALTALLPEGVLVEAVQVLSSKRLYDVSRDVIRARLGAVLRLPRLQMPNKRTYLRALDLYVDYPRLSFVDALCAAHAQRQPDATVISFDRDFRGIPGVTWREP